MKTEKELKEEIEKCNEYHNLNIRCDVLDEHGKPCNEPVEPSIDFDARATSDNHFEEEYQRSFHTSFSCEKHGAVPININGEPVCDNKPEEVFGEFREILETQLKTLQERNSEVKEVIKHAIEILINNYYFHKSQNIPKKEKQMYRDYMVGIYNRFDELGLIYSEIEDISFNKSIEELEAKSCFDDVKELLQKLGLGGE